MEDGRKWKRIPCVVLHEPGYLGSIGALLSNEGVPIVQYSQPSHTSSSAFGKTLRRLQDIVDAYYGQVLSNYQKVGLLVDCDHGRCRVKWALQKKGNGEDEYYYSSADRRRLSDFVTVHRDLVGIEYEAKLFEELINDPKTRERDIHPVLEQNPAFLMGAMGGVPISHKPRFAKPKDQTPDFVLPPSATLPGNDRVVELAELKGPHAPLLTGKLHRGFPP